MKYVYSFNIADYEFSSTAPCDHGWKLFDRFETDRVLQLSEDEILSLLTTWYYGFYLSYLHLLLDSDTEEKVRITLVDFLGRNNIDVTGGSITKCFDHAIRFNPALLRQMVRVCMVQFYRECYATRKLEAMK